MIGCICCHGPTDDDGDCYICDAEKIDKKVMASSPDRAFTRIIGALSDYHYKTLLFEIDVVRKTLKK